MAAVEVLSQRGERVGEVHLDESIFGVAPNIGVMHQVVTAQLAARRAGTHNTKGRSEVAGGGSKPWRQKGTGRARHGSIRAPQWRGGGAAHGPKPRSYRQRTPKKMKRLALVSALSDRADAGRVIVVDRWSFDEPRTRDAKAALGAIGARGRVLVVLEDSDATAYKSFRNLTSVHCLPVGELNTHDVLNSDVVVFTAQTLPGDASPRTEAADTTADDASVDDAGDEAATDEAATEDSSAQESIGDQAVSDDA